MNRNAAAALLVFLAGCEVAEPPAAPTKPLAPAQSKSAPAVAPNSPSSTESKPQTPTDYGDAATALAALKNSLSTDDAKTLRQATLWLSKQGGAAVEPTRAEVQEQDHDLRYRLACLNVLGYLGPPAAEAIPDAAQSETPEIRVKAIDVLGSIKPTSEPIVNRLIEALDDPDERLRRSAIQSLGRIGKPANKATPKLQAILNSDANDSLRGAAKVALKQVDPRVGFRKD